jgi:hypothetical protein
MKQQPPGNLDAPSSAKRGLVLSTVEEGRPPAPPRRNQKPKELGLYAVTEPIQGVETLVVAILQAGLIAKNVQMIEHAEPIDEDGNWRHDDATIIIRMNQVLAQLLTRLNRSKRRADQNMTIEQARAQAQKLLEVAQEKERQMEAAKKSWQSGGVDRLNEGA